MYTFFLVIDSANQSITPKSIAARVGAATEETSGRCVVKGVNGPVDGWIAVSSFNSNGYDMVEESYEELKVAIEKLKMGKPLFFLVEGRDTNTSLADDLLASFDAGTKAVIDNDHGIIAELAVFKKLSEMGVNWLYQEHIPDLD